MKIAQIAPLYEAVPPRQYGGTERIVAYLTDGLVSLGHEVTLFASADSRTSAKLVPIRGKALRLDPQPLKSEYAAHLSMLDEVPTAGPPVRYSAFPRGSHSLPLLREDCFAHCYDIARPSGPLRSGRSLPALGGVSAGGYFGFPEKLSSTRELDRHHSARRSGGFLRCRLATMTVISRFSAASHPRRGQTGRLR